MVAGCGAKISKMILFFFNILVWLVSIILIGLGGFILAREDRYSAFFGDNSGYFKIVCGVVIGVGIFIFLVAFAGCCGAMKESSCMLKSYFVILLILVVAEIAGGVLALVFRGKVENLIKEGMTTAVKDYKPPKKGETNFVDLAQQLGGCCGTNGYMDWDNNTYYQETVKANNWFVPLSCCKIEEVGCNNGNNTNTDIANKDKINTEGCLTTLVKTAKDYFLMIGAVAIAMIAAEILAMIFACCVISGINNGEYE